MARSLLNGSGAPPGGARILLVCINWRRFILAPWRVADMPLCVQMFAVWAHQRPLGAWCVSPCLVEPAGSASLRGGGRRRFWGLGRPGAERERCALTLVRRLRILSADRRRLSAFGDGAPATGRYLARVHAWRRRIPLTRGMCVFHVVAGFSTNVLGTHCPLVAAAFSGVGQWARCGSARVQAYVLALIRCHPV